MTSVISVEKVVHVEVKYTFTLGENKTPCKKQCKLDSSGKHCVACLRTIEEIKSAGKRV